MARIELTSDEIFQKMDDFNLCNAICSAVEKRYGYDLLMTWPDSVPLSQKLAHYVWSITGFLECEGVARFFNLKCRHSAYPECFDILGIPSLAEEIRKLLKLFPKTDLGDTDALIVHFGSWKKIEELTRATQSNLYQQSKEIESALARFVREHKPDYESLLPEIQQTRSYRKFTGQLKG